MQKRTLVWIAQVLTDYDLGRGAAFNSNLITMANYLRGRGMIVPTNQRTCYIADCWEGYPPGVPTLIVQIINAHAENVGSRMRDGLGKLARAMRAAGLLDWDDIAGWIVTMPKAPTPTPAAPVISSATIRLLVDTLNANARFSLGRDCDVVANLRDSAVADGLIKELDLYTCKSLVDEPVEAPVVTFVLKGL